MKMRSIYSQEALQRILDHYHVGKIVLLDGYLTLGSNTWLHFIKTSQGEFELFSFPTQVPIDIQEDIIEKRNEDWYGKDFDKIVHSFDRYHQLIQKTKVIAITTKQVFTDLAKLVSKKLVKSFRVYGTILDLRFENDLTIWSYAEWNLQENKSKILLHSNTSTYDEIDNLVEKLPERDLKIESFIIEDEWFEIYLNENLSLHFRKQNKFPAVEIMSYSQSRNSIQIFDEQEIYYQKELKRSDFT